MRWAGHDSGRILDAVQDALLKVENKSADMLNEHLDDRAMLSCLSVLLPKRCHDETTPLLSEKQTRRFFQPTPTTARLAALRAVMEEQGVDAYVIPTADAHNSENVGEHDKRRVWISGFTGSAGVAVVTHARALLFTDSRYFVQASKELDANWTLMKVGLKDVPTWEAYLASLPKGSKIGLDPRLLMFASAKSLLADLSPLGLELKFLPDNLVDKIWTSQPKRSQEPIQVHSLKFAGKPASEKIATLREYLAKTSTPSASFLLTSLANIAWILNLRGSDIPYNPFFYAYLLVGPSEVTLWVQDKAVTDEVKKVIASLGGKLAGYDQVWEGVKGSKVLTSPSVSWALVQAIGEDNLSIVRSPVDAAQAIKNPVELEGFRRAYLRDGLAWVRWAAWLEREIRAGAQITEWEAAEKLTAYRRLGENFVGLAYENISATGENAALPHYAPDENNTTIIDMNSPYLNDSGPQYLDATIDTTRTMHFGKPTKEQRRAFTRVLQGHIAVDSLIFPEGTTGLQIDVLARSALWKDGMNYLHGTGHGVGSYLSVHEGPQAIGSSLGAFTAALTPGHVQSNEPGFYEVGSFGIRIESVVGVKEVTTRRAFGDKKWLGFERFTTIPIQSSLVDFSLLSVQEKRWLKDHNQACCDKLIPLLGDDTLTIKYLKRQ